MKKSLNIMIVTTMPFPSGAASVNRIISYSKGLVELGLKVTVFSSNIGNTKYQIIDGIIYKSFQKKSNNKLFGLYYRVISVIKLLYNILISKEKFNTIILVSNSLVLIYPLFILCKILGINFIQEKSEYPFVLKKKSLFGRLYAKFYVSTTYKLFDGLIIMTNPLYNYFENKVKRNCKLIVAPMTVDVTRFNNINKKNYFGDYIAYCGDIGGNKDGVRNLIHAFSLVEDKYPELMLLLIGGTKNIADLEQLKNYSIELKTKRVCFLGQVDRNKIPSLLSNSKLLALARPNSLQSTGGFPTKLGEYLSTGKPVLVTKVGDIPLYLSDEENAFLVEPDDNNAFANKIIYILDNYNFALDIANKGKELTETIFNYKVQAKRLCKYLYSF
ncbi:MAG: glycosyltransferase [Melioribacteraceae bacterium]